MQFKVYEMCDFCKMLVWNKNTVPLLSSRISLWVWLISMFIFQELPINLHQQLFNILSYFWTRAEPLRNDVTDWWGKQILKVSSKNKASLQGRGCTPHTITTLNTVGLIGESPWALHSTRHPSPPPSPTKPHLLIHVKPKCQMHQSSSSPIGVLKWLTFVSIY